MADRYFQCAICKELTVLTDLEWYISNPTAEIKDQVTVPENIENEICDCAGTKPRRRLRELTQSQYNMEDALNRPINQ